MNLRKRVFIGAATLALAAGAVSGGAAMAAGTEGHTAAGVWCVQRSINYWHQRTKGGRSLHEDGKFGNRTHAWGLRFQKASHLRRDGVVGKKTGNSILANLGGEPKQRAYCYKYVPSSTHR